MNDLLTKSSPPIEIAANGENDLVAELELDVDQMMEKIALEAEQANHDRRERALRPKPLDTFGLLFSF